MFVAPQLYNEVFYIGYLYILFTFLLLCMVYKKIIDAIMYTQLVCKRVDVNNDLSRGGIASGFNSDPVYTQYQEHMIHRRLIFSC